VVSSVFVETYQSDRIFPMKVFLSPPYHHLVLLLWDENLESGSDTQHIPDLNPEEGSLRSLSFSALAIPRQSTGTQNYMQASVGRMTDERVRFKPGKDIDKRTRGRTIVHLEYDCKLMVQEAEGRGASGNV
jgi:hypothetical protein